MFDTAAENGCKCKRYNHHEQNNKSTTQIVDNYMQR